MNTTVSHLLSVPTVGVSFSEWDDLSLMINFLVQLATDGVYRKHFGSPTLHSFSEKWQTSDSLWCVRPTLSLLHTQTWTSILYNWRTQYTNTFTRAHKQVSALCLASSCCHLAC